jgi:predicted component of type VI protein secretion system
VQPVELARKLAKEMDENKTVSVAHTYVPNQYAVYLSPSDREQFTSYEAALKKELSDYLLEHARSQGLALVTRPSVALETDERLGVGEFGIQAWLSDAAAAEIGAASEEAAASEMAPSRGEFGHTRVYSPDRESPRELSSLGLITERPLLVGDGKRTVLAGDRVLVGRSRECDLVLEDPNVSRRHAEMRRSGGRWTVVDLGSTNGVRVNGKRIRGEAPLSPGDQITLGVSKLTFELE